MLTWTSSFHDGIVQSHYDTDCVFRCLCKSIFQMIKPWKCVFQVPIKCVQQKLYVRISAHIYNELAEYQLLADAILQLTEDCDKTL